MQLIMQSLLPIMQSIMRLLLPTPIMQLLPPIMQSIMRLLLPTMQSTMQLLPPIMQSLLPTMQSIMQLLPLIMQSIMQLLLPNMQLTIQLLPPIMPRPLPIMQFITPQCWPLTLRLTTLKSPHITPLMPQSLVPTLHQLCPTLQLMRDSLISQLSMQWLLFTQRHTLQ